MSTLDLDALKSRWAAQSREVDERLTLDVDAVRRRLSAKTATALERQRRRRLHALAFDIVAVAATLAFMVSHHGDLPYLLLALPFALFGVVVGQVDLREWLALGRVDFAQPLTQLRSQYDALRERRLQVALAVAQLSVLSWLPLIMLLMKGLAGVDLLRYLPFSYIATNVGLGIALVPAVALAARWIARRRPDSPAWRRFFDETAGSDWQHTSDQLNRQLDFERELADGAAPAAVGRLLHPPLPAAAEALRVAARRRNVLGLVVISALILCSGGFNMRHGGDAAALIPGVLLHLSAIGWLIAAIVQHEALAAPGEAAAVPWCARLRAALRGRRLLLQAYVAASPLLALALAQVLALGLGSHDLWQWLGPVPWLGLGLLAVLIVALLLRRWRRRGALFAAGLVNALSLDCLRPARDAADAATAGDGDAASARDAP